MYEYNATFYQPPHQHLAEYEKSSYKCQSWWSGVEPWKLGVEVKVDTFRGQAKREGDRIACYQMIFGKIEKRVSAHMLTN